MNHTTDLIVALDFPRADKALDFVNLVEAYPLVYKIGLELFMSGGPDLVRELVHRKKRVFLDLKFHDIPNTVARAVKQAALLHAEMITLHLSGGSSMLKAVAEELADIPHLRPKVLGVSVLTSFDDVKWAEMTRSLTGHAVKAADSVLGLVENSSSFGIDGIVCSAMELETLKSQFPGFYTVVPGIRLAGDAAHDQARVTTPGQAHRLGANAIVIGRPITLAQDPCAVIESIFAELKNESEFAQSS